MSEFRQFSKEKLFDLKRIFDAFDEDCDGILKTEEARMAVYAGGPILYDEQVAEALRNSDTNGIGAYDLGQYFIMLLKIYNQHGTDSVGVFLEDPNAEPTSIKAHSRLTLAFKGLCQKAITRQESPASKSGSAIGSYNSGLRRTTTNEAVEVKLELTKTALITMLSAQGPHPLERREVDEFIIELSSRTGKEKAIDGEEVNVDEVIRILNAPIAWPGVEKK